MNFSKKAGLDGMIHRQFYKLIYRFKPTLTRKYLWNTKRLQPLLDSKGYWIFRISSSLENKHNFWGSRTYPKLSKCIIILWAYNQVSMTFRPKDLARSTHILKTHWFWTFGYIRQTSGGRTWPKLVEKQTNGHHKSKGPQPLGLGPKRMQGPHRKYAFGIPRAILTDHCTSSFKIDQSQTIYFSIFGVRVHGWTNYDLDIIWALNFRVFNLFRIESTVSF